MSMVQKHKWGSQNLILLLEERKDHKMLDSLGEIAASKLIDHITRKEKKLNNSRPRLEHFRMNKKSRAEDLFRHILAKIMGTGEFST